MNEYKKNLEKHILPLFIVFYTVGLLLFVLPYTRQIFINITSYTLLLVIGIVFSFHKKWNSKTIFIFLSIILTSFLIEMFGVKSGKIFGNYLYDESLGIKLAETPIIIGVNWLFLVYASRAIATGFFRNKTAIIAVGVVLMLLYDIILEAIAPFMHMWHFTTPYPPMRNFLAWLIAATLFHSLLTVFKIDTDNKPSRKLFWVQICFFSIIAIIKFLQ